MFSFFNILVDVIALATFQRRYPPQDWINDAEPSTARENRVRRR